MPGPQHTVHWTGCYSHNTPDHCLKLRSGLWCGDVEERPGATGRFRHSSLFVCIWYLNGIFFFFFIKCLNKYRKKLANKLEKTYQDCAFQLIKHSPLVCVWWLEVFRTSTVVAIYKCSAFGAARSTFSFTNTCCLSYTKILFWTLAPLRLFMSTL